MVALIVWLVSIIKNLIFPNKLVQQMHKSLQENTKQQNRLWNGSRPVNDMAELYIKMVCKHGPDSEEAKAFRFGTDSSLVKLLHDDDSISAFNAKADIVDRVYRESNEAITKV